MKKLLAIIICLATVLSLCACGDVKKHTADGFSIQLPRSFKPTENMTYYTLHMSDGDVFVWAVKDEFLHLEGSEKWSVKEYMDTLYGLNESKSPTPIAEEQGIVYFSYNAFSESKAKNFTYFSTAFKASDAFYTVQFVCEDTEYENYRARFIEWAKTVKVK